MERTNRKSKKHIQTNIDYMKIHVNQKEYEVPDGLTVKALLDRQQIPAEGTAVAVDNKLVPKADWESRTLADGEKVTVIRAAFGG